MFRRSGRVLTPEHIDALMDPVKQDAEAFLATLDMNVVCDVREQLAHAGKYQEFTVFMITVYYLEEL